MCYSLLSSTIYRNTYYDKAVVSVSARVTQYVLSKVVVDECEVVILLVLFNKK